MIFFEWILVLLFAAVVLTAAADRLRVPYPSLLALAGAGIAFLPFAPNIRIEPDLALALFHFNRTRFYCGDGFETAATVGGAARVWADSATQRARSLKFCPN